MTLGTEHEEYQNHNIISEKLLTKVQKYYLLCDLYVEIFSENDLHYSEN